MNKIVFIAGRGHSGSTLLNLMRGGHPRLIAVGEVYSLFGAKQMNWLERGQEVRCSCGMHLDQCEFWGPVAQRLRENDRNQGSVQEAYCIFLESFHEYFGADAIPVDISKTDEALQALRELDDVELNVIFLIRDVRSWAVSMRDVNRRAGEFKVTDLVKKFGWKAWRPFLGRTTVKYFWHWYLLNKGTQKLLRENGIKSFQIGYEELTLYPDFIMRKISEFLEVDFVEDLLRPGGGIGHVIIGNRMRSDPNKRERVAYDDRWFYSLEWQWPAILFPNIMRYNSAEVYRNIRGHLWK